jgi:hypothetical protein
MRFLQHIFEPESPLTALVSYDAACAALAAAVTADEVMSVRLEANAIAAVARVAKNLDLEVSAVKLRVRAEARLGDILAQAERSGLLHSGRHAKHDNAVPAEGFSRLNLRAAGIDHKLSARAQKLNGIGARAVDAMLNRFEQTTRERGKVAHDVIRAETAQRSAESRRQLELFAREDDGHPLPANFYTWGNESKNTALNEENILCSSDPEISPPPQRGLTGELAHDQSASPPAYPDCAWRSPLT